MLGNIAVLGAFMPFVYRPMEGGDFLLVTLVALGSVGGMVLIIAAYRAAEAVVVAPMQYSQIVWAVFYGALFFEESPDAITLVGAAVVMGSGIYILLREQKLHGAPVAPAAPASTAGVGLRPRR
jgi:S-adenosylmethionine uptake transporter